jgi:hypothetical protein
MSRPPPLPALLPTRPLIISPASPSPSPPLPQRSTLRPRRPPPRCHPATPLTPPVLPTSPIPPISRGPPSKPPPAVALPPPPWAPSASSQARSQSHVTLEMFSSTHSLTFASRSHCLCAAGRRTAEEDKHAFGPRLSAAHLPGRDCGCQRRTSLTETAAL